MSRSTRDLDYLIISFKKGTDTSFMDAFIKPNFFKVSYSFTFFKILNVTPEFILQLLILSSSIFLGTYLSNNKVSYLTAFLSSVFLVITILFISS